MAAWHETMVTTEELRPNSCISTYVNDTFAAMDTYVRNAKLALFAHAKRVIAEVKS
jgi:hypothetical protein